MEDLARLVAALDRTYRIERELGSGGMATVYLAYDVKHDRQVAIKVLRPELAAVIGAGRFLREIKTIATLQHPHILGLIDSGEVNGTAFYVMPFVDGESLRDRLTREKQLPVAEAVRIANEVAGALDYAHRHGVIHRDIKPENVMLHDGSALVADFGIALAASSAGNTRMTETGMSLGTPQYMSPEQVMGEREITARSDVYALGAMTYEMLIGEPPFSGPTAQSIVARVVTEQPRSLVPQRRTIPPHVEAAVLTALEKLPADRFATARELAEALSSPGFSRTVPVTGVVAPDSRRWARVAIGAVVVTAVFGALALTAWPRPGPAPGPVARYSLAFPDSQLPVFASLGRDGAHLVYAGPASGGGQQLWVKERDRLEAVPIPGTWLGNGDPVHGSILRFPLDPRSGQLGEQADTVGSGAFTSFSVTADGSALVLDDGRYEFVSYALPLDDALRGRFPDSRRVAGGTARVSGLIAPDGSRLLLRRLVPSSLGGVTTAYSMVSFSGGAERPLTIAGGSGGVLWADSVSIVVATPSPRGTRIAVSDVRTGDLVQSEELPDSSVLAVAVIPGGLAWVPSVDVARVRLGDRTITIRKPAWFNFLTSIDVDPRGERVALTGWNQGSGDTIGVFVGPLTGGGLVPWAAAPAEEGVASFLEDGTLLWRVYDTQESVALSRLTGPGRAIPLGRIARGVRSVSVSRDLKRASVNISDYHGDAWVAKLNRQ